MSSALRILAPGSILVALAFAVPILAQDDFRHLDEGRPTKIEDAYPLKFLEWEWQLGAQGRLAGDEQYGAESVFEFKVGAAPNLQIGVEGHGAWERALSSNATGIENFGAHVLYNLNQEGPRSPALAVRGDLFLPGIGDLGRGGAGGRLKAIATRGFGITRFHLNAAREWNRAGDGGDRWTGGLGFDRPLGFTSRAIVGDIYVESLDAGGPVQVWLDAGMRVQISKQAVLDFGASFQMNDWVDGVGNVGLIVGLSRAFGFSSLANVPRYPDPAIR